MMIGHDATPPRAELEKASVAALQSALQTYLDDPTEIATLERSLRQSAREAREKKIQAEQLLVLLKDVWFGLPQVRKSREDEQSRILQRVVTLCIREYYSA